VTFYTDPLNRLTSTTHATGEQFEYAYDAVGNRTAMTSTESSTTYEYDAANRLASVGGVTYTWDARGNLLSDGTFTYTYNAAGRMVRAESVAATLVYTYNADGLRVAQSMDGEVTTFTWDLAAPLAQVLATSDGAVYLHGLDLIAEYGGEGWAYHLRDGEGSLRQVADESRAVTLARAYKPFGGILQEQGLYETAFGFLGAQLDRISGLLYAGGALLRSGDGALLDAGAHI